MPARWCSTRSARVRRAAARRTGRSCDTISSNCRPPRRPQYTQPRRSLLHDPPMNPIIDIANLDFAYGETLVLKHVTLAIEPGTTVGLIGPNGGGKTTLIRLLLGMHEPTRGTITVAGVPPRHAIRRGDVIGYLPQNPTVASKFPIDVRQAV